MIATQADVAQKIAIVHDNYSNLLCLSCFIFRIYTFFISIYNINFAMNDDDNDYADICLNEMKILDFHSKIF